MITNKETEQLWEILKNTIEFDRDVLAIYQILCSIFNYDPKKALLNWQYLLNTYDIAKLKDDIDFNLLICDFAMLVIEKMGLKEFMKYRSKLNKSNQYLIDQALFNTFKYHGILEIIDKLIKDGNYQKEEEILNTLENNLNFLPKEIFDYLELLSFTIRKHLEKEELNKEFLLKITDRPKELKEKALLKTLLLKVK